MPVVEIAARSSLAAALVLVPFACNDDHGDRTAAPPPDPLTIEEVVAEALPGLGDDEVRVTYSRAAVAAEAADLSHYSLESPAGRAVPLTAATAAYDQATFTTTIVFPGLSAADTVNLAVGSAFRLVVDGVHAEDGGVLPIALSVDGVVTGTNAAPAIVSITPDSSATKGGVEATVVATGLTFEADTTVSVGSNPLLSLVLVDALTVRGVVARGAPGQADVRVSNSNGSSVAAGAFVFFVPFPRFEGPLSFFVEDQPFAVAVGDLDGDEKRDVVAVNFTSQSISILRGRGNGDFDPPRRVTTAQNPDDAAIADMNRDGVPDLVYVNSGNADGMGNGAVAVRLGNGDLTYGAPSSTPVARGPQSVVVADLDGDMLPDAAVVNRTTGSVSVLIGNGSGILTRKLPDIAVPGGPNAVTAADLDGDGDVDLATANGLDTSTVLRNDGAANFAPAGPPLTAGDLAQGITSGDVDGDGDADLATANLLSGDASVFFNDGAGSFAPQVLVPLGSRPISLELSDLFGTGATHLVSGLNLGYGIAVSAHAGMGGFGPPALVRTGRTVQDVAVGALTPGELPDVVTANRDSDTITVVRHREDGSLLTPLVLATGDEPVATAIADFDEDGFMDVAVLQNGARAVTILRGDGARGFLAGTPFAAGDSPTDFVAADFDGDRHVDAVVVDQFRNAVLFLKGDGAGGLAAPVSSTVGSLPAELAAIDLDADGDLDVCVTLDGTLTIGVALNDGTGAFLRPDPSEFGAGSEPKGVFAGGDFDRDGFVDLAVCGDAGNSGQAAVLFGNGTGIFVEFQGALTFENDHSIAMGDVNGDGFLDLVTAGRDNFNGVSRLRVLLGSGTRRVPQSSGDPANYTLAIGSVPENLVLRDIDFDGDLDVVATLAAITVATEPVGAGVIAVILNDGTGRFETRELIASGLQTIHVSVGDLDGDGSLDVVGADAGQDTVTVYFGRG